MNKRSLTLIMATAALVLCILSPFAGAVTISYTADSGGESVSINENYDVDNSVTVKESTDISFGNLQVDQERTAEGTGEADLKHTISGKSVDGIGYAAENDISGEGTINAKTYTSATGNTLGVAQTVSATGDAELLLEGEEGGNLAGQYARVENGRVNSKQTLDIGNSVRASLDASIWGDFGAASAMAEDADGWAWTVVKMENGELSTVQGAEAAGSATADQVSDVDADWGITASVAEDADGNRAETVVEIENGELSTVQVAEADGSATAAQEYHAEGVCVLSMTKAENQYGSSSIENRVNNGTLNSESGAIAPEDEVSCREALDASGDYISTFFEGINKSALGPYANDTTVVWDGTLSAIATAKVNATSATVSDLMSAEGLVINKSTYAESQLGYIETGIWIDNGTLNGDFLPSATDVEVFCSQDMVATGEIITVNAGAYNVDSSIDEPNAAVFFETSSTHTTVTVTEADAEATIVATGQNIDVNVEADAKE